VSQLKKNDILIPDSADKTEMEHRLKHWFGGDGFLIRLIRSSQNRTHHPVSLLTDRKAIYWVPNSQMAKDIIESKIVFVMGRTDKPSSDTTFLDIPLDYEVRFSQWLM